MFIRAFIILLLLAVFAFAQDGISPDTVNCIIDYSGTLRVITMSTYYSEANPCTCAWKGFGVEENIYGATSMVPNIYCYTANLGGLFWVSRGIACFNTSNTPTLTRTDSCKLLTWMSSSTLTDSDTLWIVETYNVNENCVHTESNPLHYRNFYQCEEFIFQTNNVVGYYTGAEISSDTLLIIGFNSSSFNKTDTTSIGFITRRTPMSEPTGMNVYGLRTDCGDTVLRIIRWFTDLNDISEQYSDGISPDTIQFICSGDEPIKTPGFWREEFQPTWDAGDPGGDDAFHGRNKTELGCGASRSCNYWNYNMQPWVRAYHRTHSGFNDYQSTRAYFLFELEEPIPDTTELDSMKFYMQFADINVKDGDSIHVVSYTPRYSSDVSDSCWICYGCTYEGTPDAWCNYYRCGDNLIWGTRSEALPGAVPTYLGWNSFNIHPSIIDFTQASVGDTFGIGLVMRFEDSGTPTDTNRVDIMIDPCPYIVYWYSEQRDTTSVSGYINYGLRPPYVNYGLPLSNPRRAWGGSRK